MKKYKLVISRHVWHILLGVASVALLLTLLWFRLGSLTYGNAADVEVASRTAAASWQNIITNPLNAPYSVVGRLVVATGHDGITSQRLISTMFGALAATLFYFVARQWHRMRVAMLATWLFISSSWFLHVSRLGTPEILWLVSILTIVVVLTPNKNGRQTSLALPTTLAALIGVLYVPGMVWLVLAGIILQRKNIFEAWEATRAGWLRAASIIGSLALIAPLIYGLIQSPLLVWQWIGLPAGTGPANLSVTNVLSNLVDVPKSLFVSSSFDPVHWLGTLPLLSSFEIIMFALGAYFYATHLRAARTRLIVALAGVAWALVGIIGINSISMVIPVVYLLLAAGIAYILHEWMKVFPNNPLARTCGIVAILLAVFLTSVYQTRSYFVAWRYNIETSKVFNTKL
ncbi:MAG TPA: hypothetical protein VF575_01500 [Candidatus Saccharimonadales bacterium]|jgi:hypothetical protein